MREEEGVDSFKEVIVVDWEIGIERGKEICGSFQVREAELLSLCCGFRDPNGETLKAPNLRVFSFNELRSATKNFKLETVLGGRGFGKVYKGWIDDRTRSGSKIVVAIKKLSSESVQGHVKSPNWERRIIIALGAARGLAFLHNLDDQVIYRDFKVSNVLLDERYNAKLMDFGLAKFGPPGGNSHVTTRVLGTYGYAAPAYVATMGWASQHALVPYILKLNANFVVILLTSCGFLQLMCLRSPEFKVETRAILEFAFGWGGCAQFLEFKPLDLCGY
ncbi:hypothetical protein Nepgr_008442 [Nepenthes gracilis]|uniref:Protein kinase domain-containing protein n=1 Tax=Nepenthes gracilis TaxID=150966 RepID=A0AAD3S9I2_NEPGR|nr:hypothetical protein Nepgr_008442 [Nepenthes gracilis]